MYLSMGNDNFGDVGAEEKVIKYKVFESSNQGERSGEMHKAKIHPVAYMMTR